MNQPSRVLGLLMIAGAVLFSGSVDAQQTPRRNKIVELLSQRKVVLGWFAPDRTAAAAQKAAADPRMDFVFLNMEAVESYKPAEAKAFLQALRAGDGSSSPHPLMVRLPIFHTDPAMARRRVAEMLDLGVHAVVFPDMESGEEATQALASMRYATSAAASGAPAGTRPDGVGEAPAHWGLSPDEYRRRADLYPQQPNGELASIFIVESEKGIANSREITRTRPTVAIPGPGTLSRVYKKDMAKVEAAIQTQLASCKEFDVPCGITAGPNDIEKRIKEGFRMIIIYDRDYPETIKIGRLVAGRN